ncbi:potassium channel family protein [Alloscardovia venturai]|uniref:Potassium channel family protein n=1 Tax=Alloscardovia venturai TaxID=1769421 RepID=A0ABW2Y5X4_9BIFI
MNRLQLYYFIEPDADQDVSLYDRVMLVIIILSLVPLMAKGSVPEWMHWLDKGATVVFVVDYILHWACADLGESEQKRGWMSFVRYPFRLQSIVDLLSILPGFTPINHGLRIFRLFRLLRIVRGLMIFKNIRRRRSVDLLVQAFKKQRESLVIVFMVAIAYIFIAALVVFNVEPQTFRTFFDALYWATVSLTTVGYGDIYPITTIGRLFTMVSSIMGIAIIALPSSILTADLMLILNDSDDDESNDVQLPAHTAGHVVMESVHRQVKNMNDDEVALLLQEIRERKNNAINAERDAQ